MAAIAIAAIVIIAAIVAFLPRGNNGGGSDTPIGVALPVYGNADLDSDIDNDDLKIIQKIISKESGYNIATYPFADAKKDGVIDQRDVDVVQKIIKKEPVSVYHLNYYNDGAVDVKTKVVDTKWPCEDLMVTYNSVMFAMTSLGLDERVVGATAVGNTSLDKYVYAKMIEHADPLSYTYDSSWNSMMDISSVSKVMLDHPKAHTMFVSAYGNYDAYNEGEIENVGCDVVRLCESNPTRDETIASVLLAGFLTDTLDRAKDLAKLYTEIWDSCTRIASTLPMDDKVGFIVSVSGGDTISGTSNQHNYKCLLAGGKSVLGATSQNIGTWILEDEYNKNIDKMLLIVWSNENNGFFFGNHELNPETILANYVGEAGEDTLWEKTDAWKRDDVYFVYGDYPTAFDLLLRGYTMYPEYYGALYEESCKKMLSFISGGAFEGKNVQLIYKLSELQNY